MTSVFRRVAAVAAVLLLSATLAAQGTRYDLRADEAIGGHTLERHVGKSDAALAQRLRRESRISTASTYTDLPTAEAAVGAALAAERRRVDGWARRRGPRPNFVVNYTAPNGRPLGRSLTRGARQAVPASRALVVLRWDERRGRWFVLTSYPEARP